MTQPLNMYGAVDLSALKNPPPAPAAANGGEGFVRDVTDASFPAIMETSRVVPVVVDLWAEWCQPCKTLGPILEKLAAEYGVPAEAIATAWIVRHPADMQVVLGTTSPDRVRAAALGADVPLTRPQWYELYRAAGHLVP